MFYFCKKKETFWTTNFIFTSIYFCIFDSQYWLRWCLIISKFIYLQYRALNVFTVSVMHFDNILKNTYAEHCEIKMINWGHQNCLDPKVITLSGLDLLLYRKKHKYLAKCKTCNNLHTFSCYVYSFEVFRDRIYFR